MSIPLRDPGAALLRRPGLVRRRRRLRLAVGFGAALLEAGLLVGLPVAVGVWMATSPYFSIRTIEVAGGDRVSADWLRRVLAPLEGEHVLRVGLEEVRTRLGDHPWIAVVEVRRELPDGLRVQVRERTPVAVLLDAEGPVYLDRRGERIAPCVEGEAPQLPRLVYDAPGRVPVGQTLAALAELDAAAPRWALATKEVEVLGGGDFRARVDGLPFPLLLRQGTVAAGVTRLERVLAVLPEALEGTREVDLRFPGRAIVERDESDEDSKQGEG